MSLYELQYAQTTGSVIRSEEYWRWLIGRRYAHVIWVACQGETVRGYAFVKDHKILEIATDPGPSPGAAGPARAGPRRGPGTGLSPGHGPCAERTIRSSRRSVSAGGRLIDQDASRDRSPCITFPTSAGS